MTYAHPILGALVVALVLVAGLQGLRSRHAAPYATAARRWHVRFAPAVWVLCGVALVAGVLSTALLRDDLAPGRSAHLSAGASLFALLTAARFVSRRVSGSRRARRIHPWIGVAAMVAAVVTAILGMGMLPY